MNLSHKSCAPAAELDPRLDTAEKRWVVAARLDNPGWRPRNAAERDRNKTLRQAVLGGWCYIPSPSEAAGPKRGVLAEIDARYVQLRPIRL